MCKQIATSLVPIVLLLSFAASGQAAGRVTSDEQNTIDVFRSASRGVVHISARAAIESPFEREVIGGSVGTGFVVDKEGRIVTAFHVVKGMDEVNVVLASGRRLAARLVGTAPQLDIALLQVTAPQEELFPLPLGVSAKVEVGQKVLAIGNPIGLHNTLTVGVVSALQRTAGESALELNKALIQTDAAINPGNSGGPLLNSSGEVIGVNDAIIAGAQNLGFAIPIDLVRRVIPDLVEMGHPYRPQLGFSGTELTPNLARLFGISRDIGFLVEEVLPNSPAAFAGLVAGQRVVIAGDRPVVLGGDIIISINGKPFTTTSQLAQALLASKPGQRLWLRVDRQGRELDVFVPLQRMQMQF